MQDDVDVKELVFLSQSYWEQFYLIRKSVMIYFLLQKVNGDVMSHMPHSWPATSSKENGVKVTPIGQYYRYLERYRL